MSAEQNPSKPAVECDGSFACQADVHVHGCWADHGNCDEPTEWHAEQNPRKRQVKR